MVNNKEDFPISNLSFDDFITVSDTLSSPKEDLTIKKQTIETPKVETKEERKETTDKLKPPSYEDRNKEIVFTPYDFNKPISDTKLYQDIPEQIAQVKEDIDWPSVEVGLSNLKEALKYGKDKGIDYGVSLKDSAVGLSKLLWNSPEIIGNSIYFALADDEDLELLKDEATRYSSDEFYGIEPVTPEREGTYTPEKMLEPFVSPRSEFKEDVINRELEDSTINDMIRRIGYYYNDSYGIGDLIASAKNGKSQEAFDKAVYKTIDKFKRDPINSIAEVATLPMIFASAVSVVGKSPAIMNYMKALKKSSTYKALDTASMLDNPLYVIPKSTKIGLNAVLDGSKSTLDYFYDIDQLANKRIIKKKYQGNVSQFVLGIGALGINKTASLLHQIQWPIMREFRRVSQIVGNADEIALYKMYADKLDTALMDDISTYFSKAYPENSNTFEIEKYNKKVSEAVSSTTPIIKNDKVKGVIYGKIRDQVSSKGQVEVQLGYGKSTIANELNAKMDILLNFYNKYIYDVIKENVRQQMKFQLENELGVRIDNTASFETIERNYTRSIQDQQFELKNNIKNPTFEEFYNNIISEINSNTALDPTTRSIVRTTLNDVNNTVSSNFIKYNDFKKLKINRSQKSNPFGKNNDWYNKYFDITPENSIAKFEWFNKELVDMYGNQIQNRLSHLSKYLAGIDNTSAYFIPTAQVSAGFLRDYSVTSNIIEESLNNYNKGDVTPKQFYNLENTKLDPKRTVERSLVDISDLNKTIFLDNKISQLQESGDYIKNPVLKYTDERIKNDYYDMVMNRTKPITEDMKLDFYTNMIDKETKRFSDGIKNGTVSSTIPPSFLSYDAFSLNEELKGSGYKVKVRKKYVDPSITNNTTDVLEIYKDGKKLSNEYEYVPTSIQLPGMKEESKIYINKDVADFYFSGSDYSKITWGKFIASQIVNNFKTNSLFGIPTILINGLDEGIKLLYERLDDLVTGRRNIISKEVEGWGTKAALLKTKTEIMKAKGKSLNLSAQQTLDLSRQLKQNSSLVKDYLDNIIGKFGDQTSEADKLLYNVSENLNGEIYDKWSESDKQYRAMMKKFEKEGASKFTIKSAKFLKFYSDYFYSLYGTIDNIPRQISNKYSIDTFLSENKSMLESTRKELSIENAKDPQLQDKNKISKLTEDIQDLEKVQDIKQLEDIYKGLYTRKKSKQTEKLRKLVKESTLYHANNADPILNLAKFKPTSDSGAIGTLIKGGIFAFTSYPFLQMNSSMNKYLIATTGTDMWGKKVNMREWLSNVITLSISNGAGYNAYKNGISMKELSYSGIGSGLPEKYEEDIKEGRSDTNLNTAINVFKILGEISQNEILKPFSSNMTASTISNIFDDPFVGGANSLLTALLPMRIINSMYSLSVGEDTKLIKDLAGQDINDFFEYETKANKYSMDMERLLFGRFYTQKEQERFKLDYNPREIKEEDILSDEQRRRLHKRIKKLKEKLKNK